MNGVSPKISANKDVYFKNR